MDKMNQNTSPRKSGTSRARLTVLLRLLSDPDRLPLYFILAALLTYLVESLSRHSPLAALVFLWEAPLAYLANYGIILLTLLLALMFKKRIAAITMLSFVWVTLGIAQCIILYTRVTPLTAVDISIALSVITIISAYLSVFQIILICLALVAAIALVVFLFIKVPRHSVRWKRLGILLASSFAAVALTIVLGFATGQLSDQFPNLATAYNDYGFPYCFGLSVVDKGVDRPEDYGEELITDILEELPLPETSPSPPESNEITSPNVIIVQLESFFDVGYMEGVTFSANPIPSFTALKEQYPSGLLTVPVFGAGTVNTEFEVLTGMRIADFGAGEYPYRSILSEATCETIAYDLLASGYRTHAIHNHEGSFYFRNEVYKNLGFEDFTSIEYFRDPTFNQTGWAHDALLTDEILGMMASTEEADLVFAVSVQGHGQYPDDYIPQEGDVTVTGGLEDDAVRSHFNYFINQLREMDAFVAALYEAVMALEEDTVLLLYGDHLPTIARDEGVTLSTTDFETEYVIITNYDAPHALTDEDLCSYQLFPTIMHLMDNGEGILNLFHRTYREDPEYLTLLAALEYDSLYGKRMAYGGEAFPVMEQMNMGWRPIKITDVYAEGDYLYVKGQNFTAYSMVALDGKRTQDTELLDSDTLRITLRDAAHKLSELKSITVQQISSKNELLSETQPRACRPQNGTESIVPPEPQSTP